MTAGRSTLIQGDQEKPVQEVTFEIRLNDKQEPAMEGLQEELEITNANALNWELDWQVQVQTDKPMYPSVRKLRTSIFLKKGVS